MVLITGVDRFGRSSGRSKFAFHSTAGWRGCPRSSLTLRPVLMRGPPVSKSENGDLAPPFQSDPSTLEKTPEYLFRLKDLAGDR
jgi:hypothetical protein